MSPGFGADLSSLRARFNLGTHGVLGAIRLSLSIGVAKSRADYQSAAIVQHLSSVTASGGPVEV